MASGQLLELQQRTRRAHRVQDRGRAPVAGERVTREKAVNRALIPCTDELVRPMTRPVTCICQPHRQPGQVHGLINAPRSESSRVPSQAQNAGFINIALESSDSAA